MHFYIFNTHVELNIYHRGHQREHTYLCSECPFSKVAILAILKFAGLEGDFKDVINNL